MSRSYREPWITEGFNRSITRQADKKRANRSIRRTEKYAVDGMFYKKLTDSYNICDYRFYIGHRLNTEDRRFAQKWWKFIKK